METNWNPRATAQKLCDRSLASPDSTKVAIGYMYGIRHSLPIMIEQGGGAIVNTMSSAVWMGEDRRVAWMEGEKNEDGIDVAATRLTSSQSEIQKRGTYKCKAHTKQWKSPNQASFE